MADVGQATDVGLRQALLDALDHVSARHRVEIAPHEHVRQVVALEGSPPAIGVLATIGDVVEELVHQLRSTVLHPSTPRWRGPLRASSGTRSPHVPAMPPVKSSSVIPAANSAPCSGSSSSC